MTLRLQATPMTWLPRISTIRAKPLNSESCTTRIGSMVFSTQETKRPRNGERANGEGLSLSLWMMKARVSGMRGVSHRECLSDRGKEDLGVLRVNCA